MGFKITIFSNDETKINDMCEEVHKMLEEKFEEEIKIFRIERHKINTGTLYIIQSKALDSLDIIIEIRHFDEDCRCLLTHFIFADDTIDKTNWKVNTLMRSYVGRGRYGIYSKLNLNPITYNKNTLEELLRKHIDLILQYRNNIETIVEGNEWVVWNKKSKNK